jgi:hypothetical protein
VICASTFSVLVGTKVISIVMMHCPWFAAPWQVGAMEIYANFGGHAAMFGDEAGLFCRILCFLAV